MAFVVLNMSLMCAWAQEPSRVTLKRGSTVPVLLTSEANSNKKGDVTAIVALDVVDDATDQILIKRGTPINLNVEKHKAKGIGKGGSVKISMVSTTAIDGKNVILAGSMIKEGRDTGTALTLGLVLGLTVLPFVGFAFFALPGEQAVIKSDVMIPNVVTVDPVVVTIQ